MLHLPPDLGDLRRPTPISRVFGLDRGRPIDRYYIDGFLERHAGDIRGRVLEFGDDAYTRRFGGARVTRSDVLHGGAGNPSATIVADLADAPHIPDASFDCVICTQVLTYVFDTRAALRTLQRVLAPGGVLLASVPGISQLSRYDADRWGEYWRFTSFSLRRLLSEVFSATAVAVEAPGNVLASIAFLHGLAVADLRDDELAAADPDYELVVLGRAIKGG